MKLALVWIVAPCALMAFASIGCSTTANGQGAPGGNNANPDGGVGETKEPEDPPHALGTILLGEAHTAGTSSVAPLVGASFVPDAKGTGKSCARVVDGCEQLKPPTSCNCLADEVCTVDESCNAKCVKPCTKSCGDDEECYFPTKTTAACRKRETFNAGALAFAGTTTPITLFPPYSFSATDMHGAPFLAGAKIQVQASGATEAGFEKFDQTFTATTFLQTIPTLDKIKRDVIYGNGSVPIGWAPSTDSIVVTVSGPGGSATCKAEDAAGHFDLPRSAIKAVSGDSDGTPTLVLSVSRQRKEVKKDLKTKGTMTTATVQPIGYIELTTSSSESTSFIGCPSGQTMCGDSCEDLQTSSESCGTCGHACTDGYCQAGKCSNEASGATCQQCQNTSVPTKCGAELSACQSDPECVALQQCVQGCSDQTCQDNCVSAHASGVSKLNALIGCVCDVACLTECKTECGG